jgi:hypothetical protein
MKFRISGFSDRGLGRRAGAAFAKADGGPVAQGAFAFATYSRSSGAPAGTPPPQPPGRFNGTKGALPLAGLIAEPNAQSN